jgi:hypothetical protein
MSKPSSAPIRTIASAIGVAPTTCSRGAGGAGSRKISIAPPHRHGFSTVTTPSSTAAGAPSAPAASSLPLGPGRILSNTGSPVFSATSE